MSYDLTFSSRTGGSLNIEQVATVLRTRWPAFHEFRPKSGDGVSLDDPKLEVQVSIGGDEVEINMPYFRPEAEARMRLLIECMSALEAEGLTGFDPQLGKAVRASDVEEMTAQYRAVKLRDRPWWKFW